MDFEELRRIFDNEKKSSELQIIPKDFYNQVKEYIQELKKEEDKSDKKRKRFIRDEIKNAEMKVKNIFSRRIGKILLFASSSKKMPEGLIPEEEKIYNRIVECIEDCRKKVLLPIFECGERGDEKVDIKKENIEQKKHMEGKTVVRVICDIPTFMGIDGRSYTLKKEDVVVLPDANAEVLCKRNAAIEVKI
ncbi:MAG: DNA replication complex subunit Gins51 [Candidatus Syntropharchaeia archaeon]